MHKAELIPVLSASAASSANDAVLVTERRDARVRAMIDQHFDLVWRSLRRLGVHVDAVDDAAQQVFLVASRRIDEILVGGERRYLLGIALRVASEARRILARRRDDGPEEAVDSSAHAREASPNPEELVAQKQAREHLEAILSSMPDELRAAFVLFDLEGMAAPEVAAVLNVPIGTVASRVRRAREFFQKGVKRLHSGGGRK